jgi:hypothetical protein
MGQMTSPKPLIIIKSITTGKVCKMTLVGQITADFCLALTTNLTQHDPHGPDDLPKTIDYHHLDMSRDDGMDEHGIDWLGGCNLM